MPDGIWGNGIGVQASSSHIFAHINAEVTGWVGNKWLDDCGFDEEAIISN